MSQSFISIGESIHASIPRTGKVMKELSELGADAYSKDSEPLNYIKDLIQSQVAEGADYIAINVDEFGETNPQAAIDTMVEYVKLVRKYSNTAAVCIDSSNDNVLIAGLKEWYDTDEDVKEPLISSVKTYTTDSILPLKKNYEFAFIGLLVGEETSASPGGSHSVDELFSIGRQLGYTSQFPSNPEVESIIDDHRAFLNLGIPSADLIINFWDNSGWSHHHTTQDDIIHISNSSLDITGRTIEQFIYNNFINNQENFLVDDNK